MMLSSRGISERSFSAPKPLKKVVQKAVKGSRLIKKDVYGPAAWWKMDEGMKVNEDKTLEAVSGQFNVIGGNGALWKRGVSGTALAFDGYFTRIVQSADKAPVVKDAITVEAWTVLGVYPYDWAAFAHQCERLASYSNPCVGP